MVSGMCESIGDGDTHMLEFRGIIGIVAVRHEESKCCALERLVERLDIFHVRRDEVTADRVEVPSGGLRGVTGDGAHAVRVRGFLEGFDDGSTLGARGADDGEERGGWVLRDGHGWL